LASAFSDEFAHLRARLVGRLRLAMAANRCEQLFAPDLTPTIERLDGQLRVPYALRGKGESARRSNGSGQPRGTMKKQPRIQNLGKLNRHQLRRRSQ